MTIRAIRRNFTGGEVSPTITSRDDLDKYKTSCSEMVNFMPQLHGGARFRGGFQFITEVASDPWLQGFSFNTDYEDIYALVFSDKELRIVQGTGVVTRDDGSDVVLATPYPAEVLDRLWLEQSGDVIYICCPGYAMRRLSRYSHYTWTLATLSFEAKISPPTSGSGTWHGTTGNYTTSYKITAVDANGVESIGSGAISIPSTKYMTEWVAGNYVSLTWGAVAEAAEYNVYKDDGGVYGFIGTSETTSFRDDNYDPDPKTTPQKAANPFANDNHPLVSVIFGQRLWIGGAGKNPTTLYASRIGDFENFNKSQNVQDDDPLELMLAEGMINRIQWLAGFGDLLLGTSGTEYKVTGSDGSAAVTATSNNAKAQSYWGSSHIRPIVVGNSILHVTRQRSQVRDLFYSLEKDGYAGNNLSILATHLFDGHTIEDWTFQQEPESIVWAVRDDGMLIGMVYMKEHEIWGWFRVETQGRVRSVYAMHDDSLHEDVLYVAVDREVNGATRHYIERLSPKWRADQGLENAVYLDSALTYKGVAKKDFTGLDHLEGCEVKAFADGNVYEDLTVASGAVSLPVAASTVHIGLPYEGVLAPLPIQMDTQEGTTQGASRGIGELTLRVFESLGGNAGTSKDRLYPIKYPTDYGTSTPDTGVVTCVAGGGAEPDATVYITQDQPRPLTVMAIIQEIE